jgi:hypothetical protein
MEAWLTRAGYAGAAEAAIMGAANNSDSPAGVRALVDQQLLRLALAVRDHRNAGRPDGDLSTSVKAADGALYTTVTISLMRSVLDFHDQIVRLVS